MDIKKKNNKEQKSVEEKKTKKVWLDAVLILLIICSAICLHLPSYKYTKVESKYISAFEDENGDTYLHDMDSYLYARQVKEYSEDKIKLKRYDDPLRGYIRSNNKMAFTFVFPAFVSIIWKTISVFFKNIPFLRFIRFMGPIISSLACIPAYIFVKKRTNILGGLCAGFTAAVSPAFFGANGFGCFDTDLLLYILPLMFMCSYIEMLQEKNFKKQLIWLSIFSIGYLLLLHTWVSHIIYYYLAIGLSLIFIFIPLVKEKFNFKKCLENSEVRISLIVIVLFTLITLLADKTIDLSIFKFLINMIQGKDIFIGDVYPDPGKFVSELMSVPLFSGGLPLIFSGTEEGLINKMGGIFIVASALITLIYLAKYAYNYVFKSDEESKNNYILFIAFALWLFGGIVCLNAGSRFTKITAIPIGLLCGLGIGVIYKYLSKRGIGRIVLLATFGFIFLIPSISALKLAKSQAPFSNDALTEVSDWIKDNTDDNAIILSWWDFGYYYEFRSERMTVADGGTFNGRYYYWLSNVFITTDEKLSSAIAKMISYSGVEASFLADEYTKSAKKGCEMLKEILVLDKDDASKLLKEKYHLNDKQIKKLLNYSHPNKDEEIIVVITKDMLEKAGPISYYANYDFTNKNDDISYVDGEAMIYRLYDNQDIDEYFEYLTGIKDPTKNNYGQILRVK